MSHYCLLSDLPPNIRLTIVRLIQEELQPLLQISHEPTQADWDQVIQVANPTLVCRALVPPTIQLCPDARPQLLLRLQEAMAKG